MVFSKLTINEPFTDKQEINKNKNIFFIFNQGERTTTTKTKHTAEILYQQITCITPIEL